MRGSRRLAHSSVIVIEGAKQFVDPDPLIELLDIRISDLAMGLEIGVHDERDHRHDEETIDRKGDRRLQHVGSLS
jgi:hypothetical protein